MKIDEAKDGNGRRRKKVKRLVPKMYINDEGEMGKLYDYCRMEKFQLRNIELGSEVSICTTTNINFRPVLKIKLVPRYLISNSLIVWLTNSPIYTNSILLIILPPYSM